jgi:predicted AlkP superfamily pyrophosphatase or phosphodiesterase
MAKKLIIMMLDGISAEYFQTERARMPFIDALSNEGCYVRHLHAEVIGVSLAGRTSMMTGQKGNVHSITGNIYWDGTEFRVPTPYDVRVQTLPEKARDAGMDVAVMGFGMLRPESAQIFKAPWWISGHLVTKARMQEEATEGWHKVIAHRDADDRFERLMTAAGLPTTLPPMNGLTPETMNNFAVASDNLMFDWVGALAVSDDAPDLIITENVLPDGTHHRTGYKSDQSHWAMAYADMLVGKVIQRLRSAGKLDDYNIAVIADHGHGTNETAIYLHNLIPGVKYSTSDGAVLHVAAKDDAELQMVTEKLAEYDVKPWNKDHIPDDYKDQLSAFVAPDHIEFCDKHPDPESKEVIGKPMNLSGHGRKPGSPLDDRLCVFYGPDVPNKIIEEAEAVQVAPTFAALLGLPLEGFPAQPIFLPVGLKLIGD